MEYKANNHLLVSGDGKLSLPWRSECIRYLSSASLRKDSFIEIASEVIFCPITFTNGSYLLTISLFQPQRLVQNYRIFFFFFFFFWGGGAPQSIKNGCIYGYSSRLRTDYDHTKFFLKFKLYVFSNLTLSFSLPHKMILCGALYTETQIPLKLMAMRLIRNRYYHHFFVSSKYHLGFLYCNDSQILRHFRT